MISFISKLKIFLQFVLNIVDDLNLKDKFETKIIAKLQ